MNIVKSIAALTGAYALAMPIAQAASISIDNSSFESSWTGWTDSDPSAISSDAHSGSKSAKITGSGGAFEQTVSVSTNTNYTLTAWIDGKGTIGAVAGSTTKSTDADTSSWEETSVTFNSGSNTSVTIYGGYNDGEGRFDDFSLESSGGSGTCTGSDSLSISSATDDGSNDGHGPSLTIDSNLANESRWSSNGAPKWILYDLGEENDVTELEIAFYKGNERNSYFYIETSIDGNSWVSVLENAVSSGNSNGLELFDITDSSARYVRYTGNGNSVSAWNSILELNVLGCGEVEDGEGYGDLDPNLPPSGNFELNDWYLSIPTDDDASGTADSIKETALASGYTNSDYFYTGSDGGMVFKVTVDGYKTSTNTSYTRTELRGMLRRGDTNIDTQGVNANNWVFSSAPSSAQNAAGGVDGTLTATLAVNHVSTTGDSNQVGRVVIGQIHADNDEPARLYYRKLPGHTKGSIYLAHEPSGGDDIWYEMIGSRSDSASNPSDGIALDEKFGYEIRTDGNDLWVTIKRDGKSDVVQYVDMSNSGYDVSDDYMYFKAGVYIQDNTGDSDDYAQATFYQLDNSHDGYDY